MKKKFFLIGALVAMSMSAMFVACGGKNEPAGPEYVDGCKCDIVDEIKMDNITTWETTNAEYTMSQLNAEGVYSCSDLEQKIQYTWMGTYYRKNHHSVTCYGAKVEKRNSDLPF